MAGPVFGFTSLAADRGLQVDTGDDPGAFLGVSDNSDSADANIQNRNDESLLYYLNDNSGEFSSDDVISADVVAFDGEPTALDATVQTDGSGNDYVIVVDCSDSDLNTAGYPTIEVVADNGDTSVELERTVANSIDVNCRGGGNGGGNPGGGFDELTVTDVDAYTSPGDNLQEFAFIPSDDLNPGNELVRIDLNDPHPESVDYEAQPTYYPDVTLEQGSGSVGYDTDANEIHYDPGSQDSGGDEIIISVGDFASYGSSGPHEITFLRDRTGAQGNTFFDVRDTGNTALEHVDVSDVPSSSRSDDGEIQSFAFTFGLEPSGSDQLVIDLSEPQNDGVDYTEINWDGREVAVEQGSGNAWYQSDDNEIRYQAADDDQKGDRIELRVHGYSTEDSGGPYEVPVYWNRPDVEESDTFEIE